jgi:excisionase family DNA binding protein
MENLFTVNQVAERLQVRPKTVREWLKAGRLKGVKIGGRFWRIKESELSRFIDSGPQAQVMPETKGNQGPTKRKKA